MKQIFTIAILLLLFACNENDNESNSFPKKLEFTKENVVGNWALLRKVSKNFVEDSILVSIDTINYDYNLMLNKDGSLIWEGSVYQDWENVEKEKKLNGNGNGNWFFEIDANQHDTTYIARINLFNVYTFEGSEYTEHLKAIGVIVKLTNEEMLLETYRFTNESERHIDKFEFERVK